MSKFPKEGLSLLWNFQHGRCDLNGSVIQDMAPPNGWTSSTPLTAYSGATFAYDIDGFAKGISLDGLDDYFAFDGSDSRFDVSSDWKITEMHWFRSRSWGLDNPATSPAFGQNGVVWSTASQALGLWFMDYSTGVYSNGIALGKMVSVTWCRVISDNDGEVFDKPADGGGDVLDKWYCITWRNDYPSAAEGFIQGVPAINRTSTVINNWVQDSTARFGDGPDGHFEGEFGFFARWNRALSDEEIKLAFDATKGYFGVQ